MGKKKIAFSPLWPKLWRFKVKRTKKWCKSPLFRGRFGVRLTFWPVTQAKKVEGGSIIQETEFPSKLFITSVEKVPTRRKIKGDPGLVHFYFLD